ncbi:MAG: cytochrome C oxidase subunit IV family protein [Thermoguttaceae bacterium]
MSQAVFSEYKDLNTTSTHGHGAHVLPVGVLLGVFAVLIVLTVATVAVTWIDLGRWNLVAALGIATVKGSLVVLYFMHLKYDSPFNGLIFVAALAFLALFLLLVLLDASQYQPDIQSYRDAVSLR